MNEIDAKNARKLIETIFGQEIEILARESMDLEWAPVERWFLGCSAGNAPESVVIKTRRHDESGWGGDDFNLLAERRALSKLIGTGFAPDLYAADDRHGIVIMRDFRDASTVEKFLFADDPDAATAALVAMARTSGAINGSTVGMKKETWNPASASLIDNQSNLATVEDLLTTHCFPGFLGDRLIVEEIAYRMRAPEKTALTQWDVVPSNALVVGDRTVIIDFESSNPRHLAVDGVPYALGFSHYRYWAPLPDHVVDAMSDSWIAGVIDTCAESPSPEDIRLDLAAAAINKTLERLTRLTRIVDPNQPKEELARRRPQIIDSLERTARFCLQIGSYKEIATWMGELATEMQSRWHGTMSSRVFPAFNSGSREGWIIYHPI